MYPLLCEMRFQHVYTNITVLVTIASLLPQNCGFSPPINYILAYLHRKLNVINQKCPIHQYKLSDENELLLQGTQINAVSGL